MMLNIKRGGPPHPHLHHTFKQVFIQSYLQHPVGSHLCRKCGKEDLEELLPDSVVERRLGRGGGQGVVLQVHLGGVEAVGGVGRV